MRKTISLLLVSSLVLVACGSIRDSRINPANWFGRSETVPVQAEENTNPLIPRRTGGIFSRDEDADAYDGEPLDQITDLRVERVPGGAIVRATGAAARQGAYSVRLTPVVEDETPVKGVLTYRLEGLFPVEATSVGNQPTREVTAARKLTDQQLRGVRSIRVEGVRNARVARR